MKNKKLIFLLSVFLIIILAVVLSSTVFTVKNVSVNFVTTKVVLSSLSDKTIIDSAKIKHSGSIFFVNTNDISYNVEKNNPRLKLVSVERKFPNSIVLHVSEREELYSIKIADNKYVICDGEAKVLDLTNSNSLNLDGVEPINFFVKNYVCDEGDFIKGEIIKSERIKFVVQNLSKSLLESSYKPVNSKGLFSEITLNLAYNSTIKFTTRYGITIDIMDIDLYLTDKIMLGISAFEEQQKSHVTNGTITVFYNSTKGIVAEYSNI